MTHDYEDLMQSALASTHGVALELLDFQSAKRMRRQFYALREQLREKGQHAFDTLSFISKRTGELWIIRRDAMPQSTSSQLLSMRPLILEELPAKLMARGKRKPSLMMRRLLSGLDLGSGK